MTRILVFIVLMVVFGCRNNDVTSTIINEKVRGLITENAMIVSARAEASDIGIEIIKKGGNAFDAMVAVEMSLAVTFPYAGNLGGGGFMVYRLADGSKGALDYREKAPMAATKTMYQDKNGDIIPDISYTGSLAVGVPGTLDGIIAVHEKFGSLSLAEILTPVVELAEEGFVVTEAQANRFSHYKEQFLEVNGHDNLFTKSYNSGDTLKNIALANTLRRIIANGRNEFYGSGESGRILVDFIQSYDGIIIKEDLVNYKSIWRKPITFDYDDLEIISMSPPSSGGVALGQILKSLEPYDLEKYGHNSPQAIALITEAERRAYADRSQYLGDPDFVNVPVEILLSEDYIIERMSSYTDGKATKSSELSYGDTTSIYESNETTHYSIVDDQGNAVAVTTTLNGAYGSKLYVDSLGFFLNNEMDDFSAKPGVPNAYGLIGAEANAIAPGKRMLSSMTPTIVEKDGKLLMVVGTPGGSTIITSVMQTIINVHEYGMTMQEAVDAPRFHHQWLPDEIMVEPAGISDSVLDSLREMGYSINEEDSPVIGKVDAILIFPDGTMEGGADRRGDDAASGF